MTRLLTIFVLTGSLSSTLAAETSLVGDTGSVLAHNQFTFAYRLLQSGDYELATKAFEDFFHRFPEDDKLGDALYYRALIAWLQDNHQRAAWYLAKTKSTQMVADAQVDLLRGLVASAIGKYQEGLTYLARIDTQQVDSANVQATAWLTRARCYRHLNKLHETEASLKNAAEIDSSLKGRALLELAGIQEQMGNADKALETLERSLALNDRTIAAEAAYRSAQLCVQGKDLQTAIRHYQFILNQHADSSKFASAVLGLMWAQISIGQYDRVLDNLKRYQDGLIKSDKLAAFELAATALQRKGDHSTAAAWLKVILASETGSAIDDKVRYKLAKSQYELEQFEAMKVTIDRLRAAHPSSAYQQDVDLLLALAASKQGKFQKAEAQLTKILTAGGSHRSYATALLQRGWLYESQEKSKAAIGDYRRFLDEQLAQDSSQAHDVSLRLIKLYGATQQFKSSADWAHRVLSPDPAPDATNPDPQIQQEALIGLATALIRLKQFAEAHDTLETLINGFPLGQHLPQALYYDGLVLMSLKEDEAALSRLDEALNSSNLAKAERINALRLSALHLRRHKLSHATAERLRRLDELSDGQGLEADERLWIGRYYQQNGRPGEALRLLGPLIDNQPNSSRSMREEAILITGRCRRDLDDLDEAIDLFSQVMAMTGIFEIPAWQAKARTLMEAEKYDQALEEYAGLINHPETRVAAEAMFDCAKVHRARARQRTLGMDGKGAAAANEEARRMLLRLVILHSKPAISPVPELAHLELAEVEQALGRAEDALETYGQLQDKFPASPYAVFARSVQALHENDLQRARNGLVKLRDRPLDAHLAQRVQNQLERLGSRP